MNRPGNVLNAKPNLYLIGYRGSGKSTLAPLIAAKLGFRCVDTDKLLEAEIGQPIADFFREQGEAAFRHLESRTLESVSTHADQVISLGGGSVLAPSNQETIRQTGRVVWLNCSKETLAERLTQDQTSGAARPSLTGRGVVEEIEAVLRVREPIYRGLADLIIDVASAPPEPLAEKIATWWNTGS